MAKRQLLPEVEHRQSRHLDNRAGDSHRPTRRRVRQMQRFTSPEQAQTSPSAQAFIHGRFHPRRHLLTANAYRAVRSGRSSTRSYRDYAVAGAPQRGAGVKWTTLAAVARLRTSHSALQLPPSGRSPPQGPRARAGAGDYPLSVYTGGMTAAYECAPRVCSPRPRHGGLSRNPATSTYPPPALSSRLSV